jgi:CubicO group peptidase (beta-lactamase class C family)
MAESFSFDDFEAGLAALVEERRMVGLSAGIVHNGELVWSKGFGFSDIEAQIPATPDTPYRIGACSQALAGVLAMRLVEEGMVDLDDPMSLYALHPWYPNTPRRESQLPKNVLVRHVLSNTAQGTPGVEYRYAPNQFADLTWVIEQGSGLPYPRALVEYLFEPARMERSVPGQLSPGYDAVLAQLAKPYDVRGGNPLAAAYRVLGLERLFDANRDDAIEPIELDPALEDARREVLGAAYTPLYGVNASGGAISTVHDLARFDAALDGDAILSSAGRTVMWTSAKTLSGEPLPHGLGWFVQDWNGTKLVWQFGETPPSTSALYIKAPEQSLTFLALANTDRLCAGYDLAAGDVEASPFAKLFLEAVVDGLVKSE